MDARKRGETVGCEVCGATPSPARACVRIERGGGATGLVCLVHFAELVAREVHEACERGEG